MDIEHGLKRAIPPFKGDSKTAPEYRITAGTIDSNKPFINDRLSRLMQEAAKRGKNKC